jgi:formylglycine-generating enzyme required for sulfatase activity
MCVNGACNTPPSCQGGGVGADLHCGLADRPCCERPQAPGGTFNRLNDPTLSTTMTGNVNVESFLVTVGRFRKFVAVGKGTKLSPPVTGSGSYPGYANSGWLASYSNLLPADTAALKSQLTTGALCVKDSQNVPYATWTDLPGNNEKRPLICVSWYVAYAFCLWDGGRLPTEAEYDYVWTGGALQRVRPWGSAATSTAYAAYDCMADGDGGGGGAGVPGACDVADIVDVGAYLLGVGYWGHYDLIGDAASWMRDSWSGPDQAHPANPLLPVGCTQNCLNLTVQNAGVDTVVFRGGGAIAHWHAPNVDFDPYVDRSQNYRYEANQWRGLRCAR